MQSPEVTVVVTTKDRPSFAETAVWSALAQSLEDLEVVVVDDASDEPLELGIRDRRLRVIRREKSTGVCAARNAGLQAARGKWITFLDDDDELLPNMLEVSLRGAKESKMPTPVAVLSGIEIVDVSGQVLKTRLPMSVPKGKHYFLEGTTKGRSFTVANSLFASTRVLRGVGGFDEELRSCEHTDLMLRINAECSLESVPVVTYRLMRHNGTHLHSDVLGRAEAMKRTVEKHRHLFIQHPKPHAHYLGSMGIAFLRAGKWMPAVRGTTPAMLANPFRSKLMFWWLASLAGPRALFLFRTVRKRASIKRNLPRNAASDRSSVSDLETPSDGPVKKNVYVEDTH